MKLYYKPGACSLASHIILHEIAEPFEFESVDTDAGRTETGTEYAKINAKGYVPALGLSSGEILTEGAAILQFMADQHPELGLAPAQGSVARARMQEYLNYTSAELHKSFGPFFSAKATDADKQKAGEMVAAKFDYLNDLFRDGRTYLLGTQFSVADAYMFVVCNWANFVGIPLQEWPALAGFIVRVDARPATQKAMQAEGLLD